MLPTNLIKLLLRTSCEHETRNIFNTLPKINLEVGRQMFLNKISYVVQKQPPSIKSLWVFLEVLIVQRVTEIPLAIRVFYTLQYFQLLFMQCINYI